jgi:ribosomal protein L12E/L44/L45/RPP1/RPP2
MASVPVDKLPKAERDQLAISYAAFVLNGSGAEVNADSLNAVLKAAGVAADAGLVTAVAKALKGKKVSDYFGSVGGGAAPAAETKAPQADTKAAKPKEEKKKEAPPPPPPAAEEEEVDMGDLFG